MIKLELDPWCHEGCRAFAADVEGPTTLYLDSCPAYTTDTIIRCEHRGTCKGIKRYLEKQQKNTK